MTNVFFCKNSEIEDECLKYAVIVSEYKNKWIFCRHKERSTWEIPGGHREPGEEIETTARRELAEETGATLADIRQVSVYGVEKDGKNHDIKFIFRFDRGTEEEFNQYLEQFRKEYQEYLEEYH